LEKIDLRDQRNVVGLQTLILAATCVIPTP
jgi:hypothetical protein